MKACWRSTIPHVYNTGSHVCYGNGLSLHGDPTMHHSGGVKRILHNEARTMDHGLHYMHNNKFELVTYMDSDWGGSPNDRKSTTRWVFSLGFATIAWSSKMQQITALSSIKAEYISITLATYEAVWLRCLHKDLNEKHVRPRIIHYDNINQHSSLLRIPTCTIEQNTLICGTISFETW